MNKTVKKVFLLVGLLVAIFIAWQLIFNDGGILKTGYNAIANGINDQWGKVAGGEKSEEKTLVPIWKSESNADYNKKGFDINTTK